VEENAAAAGLRVSREDIASLEQVGGIVAGERYTEAGMRAVNR
jgi:hypothetical protein